MSSNGIIEIKETMKRTFYSSICCMVFAVAFMILVTVMVFTLAKTEFQSTMGILILVIFWIIVIGIGIWVFFKIRGGKKERKFLIDKESILFETPNKPTFKIKTSEFNTIEVTRLTKQDLMDTMLSGSGMHSRTIHYKFHFLEAAKVYIIESQKDYSAKALKKIMTALEQFCQERGKTYTFKKRG